MTELSLPDLGNPDMEWTDIARGMSMLAVKVEIIQAIDQAFADAIENTEPCLIEVTL